MKTITTHDIAIIGYSVRVAGCYSGEDLWNVLESGKDCISDISEVRFKDIFDFNSLTHIFPDDELKCGKASYIERIDSFDNEFFELSPNEAILLDPNQRIFTEVAYEALEHAGYGGDKAKGSRTGVYVAFNSRAGKDYEDFLSRIGYDVNELTYAGNVPAMIASRLSYHLDFHGPSMLIDTACSSSLVTLHTACQGIRNGDCDMALAGGITLNFLPLDMNRKMGIEASDGITRTFDNWADGTGTGEGAIVLVIKFLHKAIADKDNIYAIIKGSAINQDGNSLGITAPNPIAQQDVIVNAWKKSNVAPETISYIEAHGTGTKLGDPIEIEGITRAFKLNTDMKQFCGIGSIKSNFGHLDVTAGFLGILKIVLAMNKKMLPPTIHFDYPNDEINFIHSPVYVLDKFKKWDVANGPRRAGVSAFGLSGTNAHFVLEEYDYTDNRNWKQDMYYLLPISAKNEESLVEILESYNLMLNNNKNLNLRDICYTASTGRGHFFYRIAFVAKSIKQLQECIELVCSNGINNINNEHIFYGCNIKTKTKLAIEEGALEQERLIIIIEALGDSSVHKRYDLLIELSNYYINGSNVNWENIYDNFETRKVSMPTYSYRRNRCWPFIETKEDENLFYNLSWEKCNFTFASERVSRKHAVIFIYEHEKFDKLIDSISAKKKTIVCITDYMEKKSENEFFIRPIMDDFSYVANELVAQNIDSIIYLSDFNFEVNNSKKVDMNFNSLFSMIYCLKTLCVNNFDLRNFIYVANNIDIVDENDIIDSPETNAVCGLLKAVKSEMKNISFKVIDADNYTTYDNVIAEICDESNKDFYVSYRNNYRYLQKLECFDIEKEADEKLVIRENGTYIIAGGVGGIGIVLANYIAESYSNSNINIILLGRSAFNSNIGLEIEKLKSKKVNTEYYQVDITCKQSLTEVLQMVKIKYKKIAGIINCAGSVSENSFAEKSIDEIKQVIGAKIIGTVLLDSLTMQDNLDFFIMFSSAITAFGLTNQSDYLAANSYLNSYSKYRRDNKFIAINWPGWKETGLGLKSIVDAENHNGVFKYISNQVALKAFEKIVNKKLSTVLVGELNTISENYLNVSIKHLDFELGDNIKLHLYNKRKLSAGEKILHDVVLTGRENNTYSELERKLARIWGNVLGYYSININADFFEIGGHSLLAVQIESEMLNSGIELADFDIFQYSTIAGMSEHFLAKGEE